MKGLLLISIILASCVKIETDKKCWECNLYQGGVLLRKEKKCVEGDQPPQYQDATGTPIQTTCRRTN